MNFIKKLFGSILALAFVLTIVPTAWAASYKVDDLKFSIDLPDSWKVATRTDYDEDFVKNHFNKDSAQWESFMKLYGYYLFASDEESGKSQYEIYISSYDDFDEEIDYCDSYDFELKMTAKASYKTNTENKDSTTVYEDYEVVEGKETKYIVFNYKDTDKDGNPMYGRLYHTVMNGLAIDFDLSAYEAISDSYLKEFDEAVLSVKYDEMPAKDTPWYELDARTRLTLTYLALIVLFIALIVVIIIFIISKIKEHKQFNRAAADAIAAGMQTQPQSESEEGAEPQSEVSEPQSEAPDSDDYEDTINLDMMLEQNDEQL